MVTYALYKHIFINIIHSNDPKASICSSLKYSCLEKYSHWLIPHTMRKGINQYADQESIQGYYTIVTKEFIHWNFTLPLLSLSNSPIVCIHGGIDIQCVYCCIGSQGNGVIWLWKTHSNFPSLWSYGAVNASTVVKITPFQIPELFMTVPTTLSTINSKYWLKCARTHRNFWFWVNSKNLGKLLLTIK